MKATNRRQQNAARPSASFEIIGEVTDIYKGAKNDYLTVKVQPDPEDYYDTYRVAVSKEVGAEVGDVLRCSGRIGSYWNKNKKVMEYSFIAGDVQEV